MISRPHDDGWVARIEEMLGDLTRLIDGPAAQFEETVRGNRLLAQDSHSVAQHSVRNADHVNDRQSIDTTCADVSGADTSDT